jgi:hypothetical protein
MVILFFRGLEICLAEDGAVGSSVPAPPRDRALLREAVFETDEISFRRGLGWIGTFSPPTLREEEDIGVADPPPPTEVLVRGERLVFGDIMV